MAEAGVGYPPVRRPSLHARAGVAGARRRWRSAGGGRRRNGRGCGRQRGRTGRGDRSNDSRHGDRRAACGHRVGPARDRGRVPDPVAKHHPRRPPVRPPAGAGLRQAGGVASRRQRRRAPGARARRLRDLGAAKLPDVLLRLQGNLRRPPAALRLRRFRHSCRTPVVRRGAARHGERVPPTDAQEPARRDARHPRFGRGKRSVHRRPRRRRSLPGRRSSAARRHQRRPGGGRERRGGRAACRARPGRERRADRQHLRRATLRRLLAVQAARPLRGSGSGARGLLPRDDLARAHGLPLPPVRHQRDTGHAAQVLPSPIPGRPAAGRADRRERPARSLAPDRQRAARLRGRIRQHDGRRLRARGHHGGRAGPRRAGDAVRRRDRPGAARRRFRAAADRQPDPASAARRRRGAAGPRFSIFRPALRHRQRGVLRRRLRPRARRPIPDDAEPARRGVRRAEQQRGGAPAGV